MTESYRVRITAGGNKQAGGQVARSKSRLLVCCPESGPRHHRDENHVHF